MTLPRLQSNRQGPVAFRFWRRVEKRASGCWVWTGSTTPDGYGQMCVATRPRQKNMKPHRWAYEALVGPIPDGMVLDHLCRNRRCVNPDHLDMVTFNENARRARGGGPGVPGAERQPDVGALFDWPDS